MHVNHRITIFICSLLCSLATSPARSDSTHSSIPASYLEIPFLGSSNPSTDSRWIGQIALEWTEADDLALPGLRGAALSTTTSVLHHRGRWQGGLSVESLRSVADSSIGRFTVDASLGIGLGRLGLLQTSWLGERADGEPSSMTLLIRWSGRFP